ncbi:MAG: hypothetical protein QOE70_4066 [Chthoniobacter sp.]|jgi:hypothetical protein|nr:hypothetical protein [Chthoniobacter sp.]
MILASGEGQLAILLLMAVFGFISWLSSKLNPGEKKPPRSPSDPGATPPRRAPAESEEERMRRFLEALGVPAESRPAPPPRPVRPAAEPLRPALKPVPPMVAQPMPQRPRPQSRPAPPPPLPPPPRRRSLDEAPAPKDRVEQIALSELTTPALPEFETISSRVTAAPADFGAPREVAVGAGATLNETLRAALASPQQLRAAFVLREVLGPPLGLQR